MSNVNDYAKALGLLEGAIIAALVELDHNFYVDAKRRLREALARAEEIVSKDVPPHRLPDGPVEPPNGWGTQKDYDRDHGLVPVSERCEGRTVLDEPGLDQPDTTEEKRGER